MKFKFTVIAVPRLAIKATLRGTITEAKFDKDVITPNATPFI